jgi:exodeoxyribonuclease VII small subunit
MPKHKTPPNPPPSFEHALTELEKTIQDLESGALGLEESLLSYQRGMQLLNHCRTTLDSAQENIRVLEDNLLQPLSTTGKDSAA